MSSAARPSLVAIACNNSDKTVGPREVVRRYGSRLCRRRHWTCICPREFTFAVFLHASSLAPFLLFPLSLSVFSHTRSAGALGARLRLVEQTVSSCVRLRRCDGTTSFLCDCCHCHYGADIFSFFFFFLGCLWARAWVVLVGLRAMHKRTSKSTRKKRASASGQAGQGGDKGKNIRFSARNSDGFDFLALFSHRPLRLFSANLSFFPPFSASRKGPLAQCMYVSLWHLVIAAIAVAISDATSLNSHQIVGLFFPPRWFVWRTRRQAPRGREEAKGKNGRVSPTTPREKGQHQKKAHNRLFVPRKTGEKSAVGGRHKRKPAPCSFFPIPFLRSFFALYVCLCECRGRKKRGRQQDCARA